MRMNIVKRVRTGWFHSDMYNTSTSLNMFFDHDMTIYGNLFGNPRLIL